MATDVWAIAMVTLGVLLGLAVYGAAAGSVGRDVDLGLGAIVGWTRFLLPPVLVVAGSVVVAGRHRLEPTRAGIGAVVGIVAVSGLAELAGGSPRLGGALGPLRAAGGWIGAGVGRPLELGLGTAGAVVVLVALATAGTVLSTGVPLSELARRAGRGLTVAGHRLVGWWGGTPAHRAGRAEGEAPSPSPAGRQPFESDLDLPPPLVRALDPDPDPDPEHGREVAPDAVTEGGPDHLGVAGVGAGETASLASGAQSGDGSLGGERGREPGQWKLPPIEILQRSANHRMDERQLDEAGSDLVAALAAHGVDTRLVGRTVGPTVTRFELELGPGVKVARVTSLSKDIAYAMASSDVRILAPIPGKSAIGVEVPNRRRQLVCLGDILSSAEAADARHPLEVALGRDIAGRPYMANVAEMPHVLISGATGAGKSSCINSLVTSILMRSTPDEVRMILVDPKRVELGQYNGLPHLLAPVVVDPKKAANALAWAVKEMERRYDVLAACGARDITSYNDVIELAEPAESGEQAELTDPAVLGELADEGELADQGELAELGDLASPVPASTGVNEAPVGGGGGSVSDEPPPERLPYILVVVDELNDLMMVAARDVEDSVCRIAQMARAVGIHLVLATQRPAVDVITGVIKANVPSRMAFSVSSLADSRVILDQPGAERLVGKGDMLLVTASSSNPIRLQGPWVSEAEVRAVVAHWRRQGGVSEPVTVVDGVDADLLEPPGATADDDELLGEAMELVVRSQSGSTSMLQRKLRVGFARAGRLMDLLERRGVVGPSEGSKARAVLMTVEELESRPR